MPETLEYEAVPFLAAEHDYAAGEHILALGDAPTTEDDPRRVQVSGDRFILPPKLLYHSCEPNAYIDWDDMTLKAGGQITKGDLVTYHYATSEYDYTVGAFQCQCGSQSCVGYFRGFLYLNPAQQAELYDKASPFIQVNYSLYCK